MTNIIAHRGASNIAPENTMPAFEKAIDLGVSGIECDVHMTKDKELVIVHDPILGRTCDGYGLVKNKTYKQLMDYDFGSWFSKEFEGTKIPLLSEVLKLSKEANILLNIEIKASPFMYHNDIWIKVLSELEKYSMEDKIIISSFNKKILRNISCEAPDLKVAPLFRTNMDGFIKFIEDIRTTFIHPSFEHLCKEQIDYLKSKEIQINAWTIDEVDKITKAVKAKLDGIITNEPELALKIAKAYA